MQVSIHRPNYEEEDCRILNNHYEGIFKLIELQSVRDNYCTYT